MNSKLSEGLEKKKTAQIAEQYRRLGYQVYANLPGYDRPPAFEQVTPDLVAKKGRETIIIEIKTRDSAKRHKNQLDQLARYAKEMPGVRFDLVMTNPSPKLRTSYRALREELRSIKHGLITEIDKALNQENAALAVTLISRLFEAFLIRIAEQNSIHPKPDQAVSPYLAKVLADKNIISPAVMQLSNYLSEVRNTAVHRKSFLIPMSTAYQVYQQVSSFLRQNDPDIVTHPELQQQFSYKLTRTELEVLSLIAEGRTNVEIAETLNIDTATVKRYVHNIYNKLSSLQEGQVITDSKLNDEKWVRLRDFMRNQ